MKNILRTFTILSILTMVACDNAGSPSVSDKTVTASESTGYSIKLSWEPAKDDKTATADLQYRVIVAETANIADVGAAEANTIDDNLKYHKGATSEVVQDLELDTKYYATVIVKDEEGNKSLYDIATFTTNDKAGPEIEDKTLSFSNIDTNSLDISWNVARDANNVKYKVVYSENDNISTVEDADANGTIGMNYTADITTTNVIGLNSLTEYFFNIIVKDSKGYKSVYESTSVSTFCFVADTMVTMGDGSKKAIQALKEGDVVKSFDEKGNFTTSVIEKVIEKKASRLINLVTRDSKITGTGEHPFFTGSDDRQNKKYPGFRNLKNFKKADSLKIQGLTGLDTAWVSAVEKISGKKQNIYNIHLGKGPATFFANGFAVHNK